jgi:hypothetical protein
VDRDRVSREEMVEGLRVIGRHLAVLSASAFVRLSEERREEVRDILLEPADAEDEPDVEVEELSEK